MSLFLAVANDLLNAAVGVLPTTLTADIRVKLATYKPSAEQQAPLMLQILTDMAPVSISSEKMVAGVAAWRLEATKVVGKLVFISKLIKVLDVLTSETPRELPQPPNKRALLEITSVEYVLGNLQVSKSEGWWYYRE